MVPIVTEGGRCYLVATQMVVVESIGWRWQSRLQGGDGTCQVVVVVVKCL